MRKHAVLTLVVFVLLCHSGLRAADYWPTTHGVEYIYENSNGDQRLVVNRPGFDGDSTV